MQSLPHKPGHIFPAALLCQKAVKKIVKLLGHIGFRDMLVKVLIDAHTYGAVPGGGNFLRIFLRSKLVIQPVQRLVQPVPVKKGNGIVDLLQLPV